MLVWKVLSLTCSGTVPGLAAVPRWTSHQIYRRRHGMGAAWTEPFQEVGELQPVWNTIKTQLISSNHFKRPYLICRITWNRPLTASLTISCILLQNTIVAKLNPCYVFYNHHSPFFHLALPLQLASQPLEVAVPSSHPWLLQLEDGEVCLRKTRKRSWTADPPQIKRSCVTENHEININTV